MGSVRNFMEKHCLHFNAREVVDAAEAFERHGQGQQSRGYYTHVLTLHGFRSRSIGNDTTEPSPIGDHRS